MVLVVSQANAPIVEQMLESSGHLSFRIGRVVEKRDQDVTMVNMESSWI